MYRHAHPLASVKGPSQIPHREADSRTSRKARSQGKQMVNGWICSPLEEGAESSVPDGRRATVIPHGTRLCQDRDGGTGFGPGHVLMYRSEYRAWYQGWDSPCAPPCRAEGISPSVMMNGKEGGCERGGVRGRKKKKKKASRSRLPVGKSYAVFVMPGIRTSIPQNT